MALSRWLAGDDTTSRVGLPANELLAPLPLLAIVVLVVNDWLLKGTAAPEWITGKLSDFAGLFAFPLLATAAGDLVLYTVARLGVPVDFTLRRWKLATAILLTGGVFAAMKLSPVIGGWVERVWSSLVGGSSIYPDPTDVVALAVLPATWWVGRRVIARGAYGRLWLAKRRARSTAAFADAARCGADPAIVRELDDAVTAWVAGGPAAPVDAALGRLRDGSNH